jgi:hypothetical protein
MSSLPSPLVTTFASVLVFALDLTACEKKSAGPDVSALSTELGAWVRETCGTEPATYATLPDSMDHELAQELAQEWCGYDAKEKAPSATACAAFLQKNARNASQARTFAQEPHHFPR